MDDPAGLRATREQRPGTLAASNRPEAGERDAAAGRWPAVRSLGRIARLPASSFLRGSMLLLAATLVASVGNYLFHVIAGRALGPGPYGALAALLSLLILTATPSVAFQTLAAREVARRIAAGDLSGSHASARQFHRWALAAAALVVVAFVALSVPLQRVMQIGALWPVAMIGVVGGGAIATATLRGVLQGRSQFVRLSFSMFADPVARVAALAILLVAGLRFGAGLGAFLAAGAVVYVLVLFLVGRGRGESGGGAAAYEGESLPEATLRSVMPYTLIALLTTALYSIDVLLARSVLPENEAGLYAAGALLGRALFFVGAAASMVMLPMVTERATQGMSHRHLLAQSLAFTAGLAGTGLLAYLVAPGLIVAVTYGQAFEGLEANLVLMGTAMSLFAVAYVGVNYLIALGRWRMLAPITAVVVLQGALLAGFHDSVREIALVQIAVMASLNAVVWPLALTGRHGGSLETVHARREQAG